MLNLLSMLVSPGSQWHCTPVIDITRNAIPANTQCPLCHLYVYVYCLKIWFQPQSPIIPAPILLSTLHSNPFQISNQLVKHSSWMPVDGLGLVQQGQQLIWVICPVANYLWRAKSSAPQGILNQVFILTSLVRNSSNRETVSHEILLFACLLRATKQCFDFRKLVCTFWTGQ